MPSLDRLTAFDLGNEPVMLGDTPERVFTASPSGSRAASARIPVADRIRAAARRRSALSCLVLLCVGLVASLIPALRASRIHPTDALRE